MSETFEQIQHRLLVASVDRLKVFVAHIPLDGGKGFGRIVGSEIALIAKRAAGILGADSIYGAFGICAVESERTRLGFCVTCHDSPKRVTEEKAPDGGSWHLCADCLAEAREMDSAVEADQGADA